MSRRLMVSVNYRTNLRFDLEERCKLLIVEIKQVVELGTAHHDHFVPNLDRLGLQSTDREKGKRLEGLGRHAAGLERALQRFPHPGLNRGVLQVEHQESAVRFHEGTRDNAREVSPRATHRIDPALDRAEYVA